MSYTIEKMLPGDAAAVIRMMRDFYTSDAVLTNGSEEIFANDVAACVGDSPYAEGYVFKSGDALLGYAMLAKSYSTEFGKPCIWIEDLYIQPPYRGQGIGSAFLRSLSCTYPDAVFRLEAEAENAAAIRVYESCGFEVLPYLEMIRKAL